MNRSKGNKRGAASAIACLAGVLTWVGVLAACGSDKPGDAAQTTPDTAPTGSRTAETGKAPDKYDPPIELSTVTFDFGTKKLADGDDLDHNPWTREILSKYGIQVHTEWSVPGAQYEQKMNLMIASGELPDFFAVKPLQFAQLAKAGLIEDLSGVYDQYASPAIKQVMEEAGPEPLQSATIGGKLLAVPWTGTVRESVPLVWIREDWMKKLGLPAPKTMDELLAVSKAFTEQDPDGNGKDDTFGFALAKDLTMATGFLNGFHAYKGIWVKEASGKLAYSSIRPEMRTALGKLQDMYRSGQIDKEFGVKDAAKVYESIGDNKIGLLLGSMGMSTFPLVNLTPNNEWMSLPIPSVDSNPAKLQHGLNINGYYWVVRKGAEHPEAIFKLIDMWLDKFYFTTSEDDYSKFNVSKDNITVWNNAPIKLYRSYNNVDLYRHLEPLLQKGGAAAADLEKLTPTERVWYQSIVDYKSGDMKQWGRDRKAGLNSAGAVVDAYIKNEQFMPDQFITTPTPAMTQKWANLQKMEDETITKIILGAPLSEFDSFVDNWRKLGGDDITREVNDWYASR